MRPIDADELKMVLNKNFGHTGGAAVMQQLIDARPTIELERKRGRWDVDEDGNSHCPFCGSVGFDNFCSNCGSDLRGEYDGE